MPQASEELRAMWHDDSDALVYLERRGIKETKAGLVVIPKDFDLTLMDAYAIRYLMDEWDYDWQHEGTIT